MSIARPPRGFTLIEMIIVVALMAILLAIAVPTFRTYLLKSQLRTAQSDLTGLALQAENYLQRKLVYSTNDTTDTTTTAAQFKGWKPASGDDFKFSYDGSATGYTAKAEWSGVAGPMTGCAITLDNANAKSMTAACTKATGLAKW